VVEDSALGVVIGIGTSVFIHLKKHHSVIKVRDPTILIIQNMGFVFVAIFVGAYSFIPPDFQCKSNLLGVMIVAVTIAFPLVLRCCGPGDIAEFYKSYQRIKHIGSESFRIKLIVVWLVLAIPLTWATFQQNEAISTPDGNCIIGTNLYDAAVSVAVPADVMIIIFGALIMRTSSIYNGKYEVIVVSILLGICIIVGFSYITVFPSSPLFVLQLMLLSFGCALFSTIIVFPLCYAYYFDMTLAKTTPNCVDFKWHLTLPEFREEFYMFLVNQLTPQNMRFYNVVSEWKKTPKDDQFRMTKASSICKVFFAVNSPNRVNLPIELLDRLKISDSTASLPSEFFDEAVEFTIKEMHEMYFTVFWKIIWAKTV